LYPKMLFAEEQKTFTGIEFTQAMENRGLKARNTR
jgi:hypothetical protein